MPTIKLTNGSQTPLRYPGGKSKITTFISKIMDDNNINGTYIEPYAGGAGIAINLLLAGKVNRVVINDLDYGVSSFWKTVRNDTDWLLNQIQKVPFNYDDKDTTLSPQQRFEYWKTIKDRYRANNYRGYKQKAFDFFMLNRMNVSGIIKGGPIGGVAQNGEYNISSRFNKTTLCTRIQNIARMRHSIVVTNFDGSYLCDRLTNGDYCDPDNTLVFIDPPYFVQGKNLYNTYATDAIHANTANSILSQDKWRWILTYDKAPEIDRLYPPSAVKKYEYSIPYSAHKRGLYAEYLFTSPGLKVSSKDNVTLKEITKAM